MSKPKSNNASKKLVENLVQVTDKNRKMCVVVGRLMLAYESKGKSFTKLGEFVIRPRLTPKTNYIEEDHKTYIHTGEEREEYAEKFKSVIDWLIKKEQLYINLETPLIKFEL